MAGNGRWISVLRELLDQGLSVCGGSYNKNTSTSTTYHYQYHSKNDFTALVQAWLISNGYN